MDADGAPLYAAREKVYPKRINGNFRRLKWTIMVLTLLVYYLTPWIRWERAPGLPNQAVLIDFQTQRVYFFFIEIWPQEFYYVTGLLVLSALGLFLVTSLAGRIWCGYMCPQTVWTDLFVHIERWVEGDRNKRMRRDKGRWTISKFFLKIYKHTLLLLVSAITGGAWIFYFADAPQLAVQLFQGTAPATAYVAAAMFTGSTYLLGGIAREQVCIYMCPWPRIQGAMFDEESLLVSYRFDRGEPRGPHKKGDTWEGRGDCVDCRQCIAVCPMGIDIRNGGQLECIQCALCIDACNEIMDRVERPRGLIGYETERNQEQRAQGLPEKIRYIRPRTVFYAVLMVAITTLMVWSYTFRTDLEVNIIRDRNPVFVTLSDGSVRNGYTIRILNKTDYPADYSVEVLDLENAELFQPTLRGEEARIVSVGADSAKKFKFFVSLPREAYDQAMAGGDHVQIQFRIADLGSDTETIEVVSFHGPKR